MRSILLPVESHPGTESALNVAWQIAQRFDSFVDAYALRPVHYQVVGAEPIVAVTFPPSEQEDQSALSASKSHYEAFMRNLDPSAPGRERISWAGQSPIDDNQIASIARTYDLTIVGRPVNSGEGSRMGTLEAALFDGGRAVIVAPPQTAETLGRNVVIAWNQSTETARTMAFAMPFLAQAERVTVLTVEGATVPGPNGRAVCDYLSRHGISSLEMTVTAGGRKPGLAMLEEAGGLGADLLVKGAYTQSRIRQMIFGGATSQILAETKLPVLLAN